MNTSEKIQQELQKLPDKPGIYIMKDEYGRIIYIGKAISLKNRVRQYFQASANHSPKVLAMVGKINEFEYIVTDSELEALILECNLIKKNKPRYNILLKDDKHYPYIKVTMNEEYPRILKTRKIEKDGAKYFGPYASVAIVNETISLLKTLFPIKTCKRVLPRETGKARPCLNYHLYQCLAPCQGEVNKDEYRAVMKDICSFLNGKVDEMLKRLELKMKEASENMDYEKAAGLRDKINSLKHISEEQKVFSTAMEDQDAIGLARGKTDACAQVFLIRGGKLIGKTDFILEGTADAENRELLTSFVKQFYNSAAYVPGEIILQDDIDDREVIEKWLWEKRGGKVHIKVPQKGEKLHLLEMVQQNAVIALNRFTDKINREGSAAREGLELFTATLGLPEAPRRIEAFDISNTGTTEVVASMVVFEDGLPARSEYRRLRIKSIEGRNDYASMQEVIYRRFKNAAKADYVLEQGNQGNQGNQGFNRLPDCILLDGGIGHVNAVSTVLKDIGINKIPLFGMVKDNYHRTRGLVSSSGEHDLANNLPLLRFVTNIQDEAHRFAVEYNKKLRTRRYSRSILDDIAGVGPARRKALIKHFGSVSNIKTAGLDDLTAVDGISRQVAEHIYDFFNKRS